MPERTPQEQTIDLRSADEATLGELLAELKEACSEEAAVGRLAQQLAEALRGAPEALAEGIVEGVRRLLAAAWRLGRQYGWAEAVEDLLSKG